MGKYERGGTSSGHAQEDFGRENAGENGKYGELKEVQKENEVREYGARHKQKTIGRPLFKVRS